MNRTHTIALLAASLFAFTGCRCNDDPTGPAGGDTTQQTQLPTIQGFRAARSDRFIVDLAAVTAGHPFKGRRANTPHQGAHVHWDNSDTAWPVGGSAPSNYPAIYAAVDGYVSRVDSTFPVGGCDRYGVEISFARNGDTTFILCYGIEPMVAEPSPGFYRQFINVALNQQVRKGDIIARMYLPPGAGIGCHIHFHVGQTVTNRFLAPAVFQPAVVDSFQARWGAFANDGAVPMPACMGYLLDADENLYEFLAVDTLK
ncbi:MAG: M23 family metallopeptidase [Candidatus Edwardsbacteria bacterium]|jgi:murein DD-endopeptidase MepM/ murein hydrolase activator NlpD|nr:M23 family metallopeptidase [Candidatus Edwardsbacteria bacterium]